jgi:hypothetical protein
MKGYIVIFVIKRQSIGRRDENTMQDTPYDIKIVFNNLDDNLKNSIRQLWHTDGTVFEPEATNRLSGVVAVRTKGNIVVSVSTVKLAQCGTYGLYYLFSTSTAKSEQNRQIPSQHNLLRVTIDYLRDLPADPKPRGLMASLENRKITPKIAARLGGMNYLGIGPRGDHILYVNFDGSYLST